MTTLPMRPFGPRGLELTTLGMGCVPLAGLYRPISDQDALRTVLASHDAGVRHFDTAPFYGHGLSEHRLGRALRRLPPGDVVVSTKVGRLLLPERSEPVRSEMFAEVLPFRPVFDYGYDATLRSLDDSLQRTGLAQIDLVLIHDANRRWHGDAFPERFRQVMEGAHRALVRLREEGVIKAFGVGAHGHPECMEFAKAGDFDGFMLAGQYTLLDQSALDDFLPYCAENRLGVLIAAPFNSGILATGSAGDADGSAHYYYRPAPPEIVDRVGRIEAVCARHGVDLPAAALQFPLAHPAVTTVVPGLQSPLEARRDVELLQQPIPAPFWEDLRAEGLLLEAAALPEA
jgi:D-threo-aldose 1-dehydrogenase